MISRDDVPETPDWILPPRSTAYEAADLTIPDNIVLGDE